MKENYTGSRKDNYTKQKLGYLSRAPLKSPVDITGYQEERLRPRLRLDSQRRCLPTLQSSLDHERWCRMRRMERKEIRYLEPASEVEPLLWEINSCPVEIGRRGFVATQTIRLLKDLWPGFSCGHRESINFRVRHDSNQKKHCRY